MNKRRLSLAMILILAFCVVRCGDGGGGSSGGAAGLGGSTSRFVVLGERLYVLTTSEETMEPGMFYDLLRVFDIGTNPDQPTLVGDVPVVVDAETVVSDGKNLFLGTATGMQIFNTSNPDVPAELSFFEHARACDPVVVQGDYSYISVRSSNFLCWGDTNALIIADVSDIENPTEVARYEMTYPWGLGVDGDLLFLCDGSSGLRIFDVTDPKLIDESDGVPTEICVDLIANNGRLVTTGYTGVAQYDYTTLPPTRLSVIPIVVTDH